MKNLFLTLSLSLTIAISSAFASRPLDPDPNVEETFKKEFPGAQSVTWGSQEGFQKVTFILAGHRMIAYFDQKDELAGCMRDIFFDQLPITVMKALDKKYPKADFSEVHELTNSEGTSYLVTVDHEQKKYKVRVSPDGNFTSIEKLTAKKSR
jgi:hypothetical protein